MPERQRRQTISARFQQFIEQGFARRVLAFDTTSAFLHGEIMARRKRLGRPLSIPDGQIASIAKANSMMVATRNTADFEETGIELIHRWGTPHESP